MPNLKEMTMEDFIVGLDTQDSEWYFTHATKEEIVTYLYRECKGFDMTQSSYTLDKEGLKKRVAERLIIGIRVAIQFQGK